jgi:mono/diheme cytochrome c family protein
MLAAAAFIVLDAAAEGPMHRLDLGMLQYQAKCSVCHGPQAKGGGSMTDPVVRPAPDLTTLAARNGGSLPTVRMWEFIEGTSMGAAPELRSGMPLWGEAFRAEALAGREYANRPDAYAHRQIDAVIGYLATLQGMGLPYVPFEENFA